MFRRKFTIVLACAAIAGCARDRATAARVLEAPPLPAFVPLAAASDPGAGGTAVIARHGDRAVLYVADEDDRAVHAFDLAARALLGSTPLPSGSRPGQLLVTPDGRLAVALRDASEIAIFEAVADPGAPLVLTSTRATAAEPIGLASSSDGALMLVASGWGAKLEAFGWQTDERVFAIDVAREPRAVRVVGDKAFVAHAAAGELTAVDLARREIARIDLTRPAVERCTSLVQCITFPERRARQGYALVEDSAAPGRLLVPGVFVAPGPAFATDGYGGGRAAEDVPTELFAIEAIEAHSAARPPRAAGEVPLERRGPEASVCLLPRAAIADPKRKTIYVACLGADVVLEYDGASRARWWHVGSGPVGLALDESKDELVVWSQFDRALTFVPLAKPRLESPRLALPPRREDAIAHGRRLFHAAGDARIAKDGRACASCHPDGRDDGLVWSSPEGPRKTMFLAGRVTRGPYGWRGEHRDLAEHIADTVKKLEGRGLPAPERDALAAYVAALPAPPARGEIDPQVETGRAIFASAAAGCGSCHDAAHELTDGQVHDIGSKGRFDRFAAFRTPPLRSLVAGSYFHDGRYATLRELLQKTDGRMGTTRHLANEELTALLAYLGAL